MAVVLIALIYFIFQLRAGTDYNIGVTFIDAKQPEIIT